MKADNELAVSLLILLKSVKKRKRVKNNNKLMTYWVITISIVPLCQTRIMCKIITMFNVFAYEILRGNTV